LHTLRQERQQRNDRALLVVIRDRGCPTSSAHQLEELRQLVVSAGLAAVHGIEQDCRQYDPAFFITTGKVAQIKELVHLHNATLVIFNRDLTPAQQRNLEDELETAVADRTGLILDIFAQRARSREGKLQVELAQLQYLLPRLKGAGHQLSRLGGGIGTRGPGETKLELDRRKIRQRIQRLQGLLQQVAKTRHLQRSERLRHSRHATALVGYTNAGKSTLLNVLAGASILAEDRLFSTLDPTTRRVHLSGGIEILMSDTVGFIEHLPRQLMAAFKATLEEVLEAELLVHVVDAADGLAEEHIAAVHTVLDELGARSREMLYVFNKLDALADRTMLRYWERKFRPSVFISARTGEGMEQLRGYLSRWADRIAPRLCLRIPQSEHRVLELVAKQGTVFSRIPDGVAVVVQARIDRRFIHALRRFQVPDVWT